MLIGPWVTSLSFSLSLWLNFITRLQENRKTANCRRDSINLPLSPTPLKLRCPDSYKSDEWFVFVRVLTSYIPNFSSIQPPLFLFPFSRPPHKWKFTFMWTSAGQRLGFHNESRILDPVFTGRKFYGVFAMEINPLGSLNLIFYPLIDTLCYLIGDAVYRCKSAGRWVHERRNMSWWTDRSRVRGGVKSKDTSLEFSGVVMRIREGKQLAIKTYCKLAATIRRYTDFSCSRRWKSSIIFSWKYKSASVAVSAVVQWE